MSSNYWTTSHSFCSILKPLVLGMCPKVIRWVFAYLRKTYLISQSQEYFWTAAAFLKIILLGSHVFLSSPRVILIFPPSPWMHLWFLTMSILVRQRFFHVTSKPIVSRVTVFQMTLIPLKKVKFQHSLSALECPKIIGFKTMTSLCPKKYRLACHFLQLPLSPALVSSL